MTGEPLATIELMAVLLQPYETRQFRRRRAEGSRRAYPTERLRGLGSNDIRDDYAAVGIADA
jgi:hypothetical protein